MTKEQVREIMDALPSGLTVDEYLVALATKAAEFGRQKLADEIEKQAQRLDWDYRETVIETIAEVLQSVKSESALDKLVAEQERLGLYEERN